MKEQDKHRSAVRKIIAAAVAAWLAFLAIDFLLHAVLFAKWWKTTGSYWLPPAELFRMIPYAYASFAIYCLLLTWLFDRMHSGKRTLGAACRFGAVVGLAFGVSIILGNYSVFRMPALALLVWPVSFLVESIAACAAAGWILEGERPWRRVGLVLLASVILIIASVALQNLIYTMNSDGVFDKG